MKKQIYLNSWEYLKLSQLRLKVVALSNFAYRYNLENVNYKAI